MKTLVLLWCEIVLAQAQQCSQDSVFMPENGVSISAQLPTSFQAVIPTLRFECQALITGGNIQAMGDLNINLQIWRPLESTGTFYNLAWQRPFRMRSGGRDAAINSSFTLISGVPVRPGDVIGFHSFVSPRLLFDVSQQHNLYYLEAAQGPLCNFSLNGVGVRNKAIPLPFISLTYVNATDDEVRLAENQLPLISNTCTPVSFIVDKAVTTTTHTPLTVNSRGSIDSSTTQHLVTTNPSSSVSSSRGSGDSSSTQGLQVTTESDPSSLDSEPAIGSSTTEGDSAQDDSFFLALSLTEFILVAVVVAVVIISACVIIMIALCCCMYVQHMAHCRGKDETQVSMNTSPVYDTVRTNAGQWPYRGIQPPCAASGQQPTLIALVPTCDQSLLSQATQAGSQRTLSERLMASSTESLNGIITPCQQQNLMRPSSTDDYSYPNLRLQPLQEHQNQRTSDGYIIVQPDQSVQENTQDDAYVCAETEICGARGAMDDTL